MCQIKITVSFTTCLLPQYPSDREEHLRIKIDQCNTNLMVAVNKFKENSTYLQHRNVGKEQYLNRIFFV